MMFELSVRLGYGRIEMDSVKNRNASKDSSILEWVTVHLGERVFAFLL